MIVSKTLKPSSLWLGLFFLLISTSTYAQQTVKGTVISDEDEQALPGATVMIKGSTTGTITDFDGNFTLEAAADDVLIFSFVGFATQEVSVNGRSNISVTLSLDIEALSEVVVLGYSEKSQKELSASVVSISAKDLQTVTSGNIETMLQGQAAGVTVSSGSGAPGAAADIRIRGITSINNDRAPLFVVDGIIGGNYVPSDVESLTILKDGAATGLYGSAGAAGVIIVTTKKGNGKPYFNASANFGVKEALTGNFEMMNGAELYEAQRQMWGEENLVSFLSNRPEDLENQNFDWLDAAFDRAIIQNYNISTGGSLNGGSYRFGVDYFNEEGTFNNTDYDRLNLRGSLTFSPFERLTIKTDVNAQIQQNSFEHYTWFEDAFWNMPWDNPYAADGSVLGPQYVTDNSNDWYGQFRRSFLYSQEYDELGFNNVDLVWSATMEYQLTDWLSLETRTRLGAYNSKTTVYHSPRTDFGLPVNGIINVDQVDGRSIGSTHFLRFSKSFGKHDIGGFIAHEGGVSQFEQVNISGQNLTSQTIKIPAGASVFVEPENGYGISERRQGISAIAEANYGYAGKYFATGFFRRDGSSLFAENKKFGNFYGGSFGWLLSEEDFLKNSGFIDFLKLRASYGSMGNDGLDPFSYLPTYNITRQYNGEGGGDPDNPANSNLGWESTEIANLGVDVSLNMGLSLTLEVYNKSVTGMLLDNPLPFSSGYESRSENIGDMTNNGIELSLSYDKKFGDFSYSGNFNISYNQNEITRINDISDQQAVQAGVIQQLNVVGQEAFQWYMPKWIGVDPETGGPLWEKVTYDGDGNIVGTESTSDYSEAQLQPIESSLPEITGGFRNSISYKGVSLNFLFTFQAGNHIYNQTRFFVDSDGANTGINLMKLQDGWSRWENPGDIATHPELQRGGNNSAHQHSSRYIEKGDFIRLRNVTLSYELPSKALAWSGIKGASVNLRADNLVTWTEFSGMDPDIGLTVGDFTLPGLSYLKYPISRQFVAGINLNF